VDDGPLARCVDATRRLGSRPGIVSGVIVTHRARAA
jgi:hypothetical protein